MLHLGKTFVARGRDARASLILATLGALLSTLPATARAGIQAEAAVPIQTTATITPTLSPERPGAHAALTLAIRYAGGALGIPSPVRRSVLRLPAGMRLDLPSLRSCRAARLRSRGPHGCPRRSRLGKGHALLEVHAGTQYITEHATLWAFLGPPRNLTPTFEILARGYTPIERRVILTGTVSPAPAPYGEQLEMSIPPIPTLAFEPDASVVTFSLAIGSATRSGARSADRVILPAACPAGGYPFGGEFTYADGSTSDAQTTVPCPPGASAHTARAARPGRAARTIALNEVGHLRLTSKHNFTLNEQGTASGTAKGRIYVHLSAVSSTRVTARIDIRPHGGSLSGYGTGSYRRNGATETFSGSMTIERGTGTYAGVHGSGLRFRGTIHESARDPITVYVNGRMSR